MKNIFSEPKNSLIKQDKKILVFKLFFYLAWNNNKSFRISPILSTQASQARQPSIERHYPNSTDIFTNWLWRICWNFHIRKDSNSFDLFFFEQSLFIRVSKQTKNFTDCRHCVTEMRFDTLDLNYSVAFNSFGFHDFMKK